MVLREISIMVLFGGNSDANRSGYQPVRLIRTIPREHDKRNLTRMQHLDTFLFRDQLTAGWNYARHRNEIAVLNPRVTESQLETGQVLFVLSNPFRQKEIFRNHSGDDSAVWQPSV